MNIHTHLQLKVRIDPQGVDYSFYITDWNYKKYVLEYAEFCGCKVA